MMEAGKRDGARARAAATTVAGAIALAIAPCVAIARSAERLAKVAARFTLDGMRDEQRALEAHLRAGSIAITPARAG